MKYCAAGNSNCRHANVGKNKQFLLILGQISKFQSLLMEPYKVYMKSDLKKMILDIIKFDIIKERSVTELLFFNDFQPSLY